MITEIKVQNGYVLAALLVAPALFGGGVVPDLVPVEEVRVQRAFSNQPLTKWENGFILAWDSTDYPAPQVHVFDRLGRLLRSHRVDFPDAGRVILRDAAISKTGTVTVAGSAFGRDSRVAPFVAWFDSAGVLRQVAQTSPFGAGRLCFAGDGTLWAAGREYMSDFNSKPEYDVLRRYGPDGRLLGSLLPRSTFPTSPRDPARDSLLASAGDRVVLYSPVGNTWVEISLAGEILRRVSGTCGTGEPEGLALTPSGSVYLSSSGVGNLFAAGPLCTLDRQSQQWIRATVSARLEVSGKIIGGDGDDVIVYRGKGTVVRLRVE